MHALQEYDRGGVWKKDLHKSLAKKSWARELSSENYLAKISADSRF